MSSVPVVVTVVVVVLVLMCIPFYYFLDRWLTSREDAAAEDVEKGLGNPTQDVVRCEGSIPCTSSTPPGLFEDSGSRIGGVIFRGLGISEATAMGVEMGVGYPTQAVVQREGRIPSTTLFPPELIEGNGSRSSDDVVLRSGGISATAIDVEEGADLTRGVVRCEGIIPSSFPELVEGNGSRRCDDVVLMSEGGSGSRRCDDADDDDMETVDLNCEVQVTVPSEDLFSDVPSFIGTDTFVAAVNDCAIARPLEEVTDNLVAVGLNSRVQDTAPYEELSDGIQGLAPASGTHVYDAANPPPEESVATPPAIVSMDSVLSLSEIEASLSVTDMGMFKAIANLSANVAVSLADEGDAVVLVVRPLSLSEDRAFPLHRLPPQLPSCGTTDALPHRCSSDVGDPSRLSTIRLLSPESAKKAQRARKATSVKHKYGSSKENAAPSAPSSTTARPVHRVWWQRY